MHPGQEHPEADCCGGGHPGHGESLGQGDQERWECGDPIVQSRGSPTTQQESQSCHGGAPGAFLTHGVPAALSAAELHLQ